MKTLCRSFIVSALLMAGLAQAADKPLTAEEVLAKSTAKLDSLKAWSADFKQSMTMLGGQMALNGKIHFKQPQQMRMEMNMPMMGQEMKMLMVLGSDMIMWQQMEMGPQKQYMKINMAKVMSNQFAQAGIKMDPAKSMNPGRQWEMTKEFYNYKSLPDAEVDGQPAWVIEGTWKESAASNKMVAAQAAMFGKSRLYIGQKNGFVQKMEMFDKAGKNAVMTMEFTNVKLDADLGDDLFKLTVPEGAKVMDMTEAAAAGGANAMGGFGGGASAPPPATE